MGMTPTKNNIQQYSIGKQIDLAIGFGAALTTATNFFSVKEFNSPYDPKIIPIEEAEGNRSTNAYAIAGDREHPFSFSGSCDVNKLGYFFYLAMGVEAVTQDGSTGAYEHTFTFLNNVILPPFTIFTNIGAEGYRRLTGCTISKLTISVTDSEANFSVEGFATAEDGVLNSSLSNNSLVITAITYQSGSSASEGSIIRYAITNSSVRLATTAALPANTYNNGTAGVGATLTATGNGVLTVDGANVVLNDLVLVKNEVATANNGIYKCTTAGTSSVPYVLTRDIGYDTSAELLLAYVRASAGTTNANTAWAITNSSAITIGTTAISFASGEVNAGDVLVIPSTVTGITNSDNKGSFLVVSSTVLTATTMTVDVINNARYDASHDESSITSSAVSVANIVTPAYPTPLSILLRRHSAMYDASDSSGLSAATAVGLRNFEITFNNNDTYLWEKPKSPDPLAVLSHNISIDAKFTQIIDYNNAQKAMNSRTLSANNRAYKFELEDTSVLLGTSTTYSPLVRIILPVALGVGTRVGMGKNDELTYDWTLTSSVEQSASVVVRNTIASYAY